MGNDGKSPTYSEITLEIAVRLNVKISAEEIQEEEGGPTVWKLIPVWKVSMTADPDPQFSFENINPNSRDVASLRWPTR